MIGTHFFSGDGVNTAAGGKGAVGLSKRRVSTDYIESSRNRVSPYLNIRLRAIMIYQLLDLFQLTERLEEVVDEPAVEAVALVIVVISEC